MTIAFHPIDVGRNTLRNRIVMSPMTRGRAYGEGLSPTPMMARYYAQRAAAGLIVTEGIQPNAIGQGYTHTPGLHSSVQVDGWRQVTDAVHAEGGLIFAQLMHTGRIGHPTNYPEPATPVGPSSVRPQGQIFTAQGPRDLVTPEPLTRDQGAGHHR